MKDPKVRLFLKADRASANMRPLYDEPHTNSFAARANSFFEGVELSFSGTQIFP